MGRESPESGRARRAARYRRRHPKRVLLTAARHRAKRLGVPFDLTEADIVIPKRCPALGIVLKRGTGRGPKDHSPTIDRLQPRLGYVRGNVRVISGRANRIKSDATPDELYRVWKYCVKALQPHFRNS